LVEDAKSKLVENISRTWWEFVEKSGLRIGACSENRVGDPIS
jgi:hypothetical protein